MRHQQQNRASNVVILQGSPHAKGNTAALAGEIARGASAAGAKVEAFFLQKMRIAACQGCQGCQGAGAKGCVIADDMHAIYGALKAATVIVFASPIYWFTISAQLKQVLDRCYALSTPTGHEFAGKRIGLVFTFGGEDAVDSGCMNAIRVFQDIFNFIQTPITGMVYGSSAAGPVRGNKILMRKAYALGKHLATG